MRVLCGGPARECESEMYRLHVEGLKAQGSLRVAKLHVPGEGTYVSERLLTVHHIEVPDVGGPRWHDEKIERIAVARQEMLGAVYMSDANYGRYANSPHYDALFMVDTDVICGPGVLARMLEVDADVVYGVFWTPPTEGWDLGIGAMPQVWDVNPYGWTPDCQKALWDNAGTVSEIEVRGGGACTLLRNRAFESRYHPRLKSLEASGGMWPGEDRSFCLGLEARGIKQVAVTGLPIVHLYTEAQRTPAALKEARELVGL